MLFVPGRNRMDFETYLADPCPEPSLSRGGIVHLLDSPARAFWNHPRLNPQPAEERDESKYDQGTAVHNLLLEGGNNIVVVSGFDNWKKDAAKEARDAARSIGKTALLTKQFDIVSAMVEAATKQIRECEELGITDLPTEGDTELTYIWQDAYDVWCRVRPDWTSKNRKKIVDIKTTGTSANPDEYSGHINRMNYPIQSVLYRRGVHHIEQSNPSFTFVAIEDEPPYLCSFHGIDFVNEDMAHEKIMWAMRKWRECLDTGNWFGYTKRICYAEPKQWDIAAWEMKKSYLEGAA